jgi:VCBS repeat-containing protein
VCTIDPGIGEVAAAGSIHVTPLSTVTYTLTGVGQGGTSAATATITVVNTPPVAEDDDAITEEDCPAVVRVLTNDSDADRHALTVVHATQGDHGSVSINPDGALVYTPSADFNGSDNFSYTVSDVCGATATAAVNIVVTPVNDPPFAVDDATDTESGVPIVIPVLTNDKDPDGDTLRMLSYTQPVHGTVADEGNGFLKYSPLSSFEGIDMFSYTIEDGSGLGCTAAVAVKVTGPILLEITSPLNGGLVKDSTVLVQGTVLHRRGLQTGVTVNGIPALIYGDQFIANEVPIQEGENTIVACAKDVDGNSVKVSVNIDAETEADCVRIRSIAYWGVAPFETMLTIRGMLQVPSITYTGPGTIEYLPKNNDDEYPIRITSEGIYRFTAEAPDAQGKMCSNEHP